MKKSLTIIPSDNKVYIDGEGRTVNCSGIPGDIHAIQWDEKAKNGWIEYVPSTPRKPHKPIDNIKAYNALLDSWSFVMSDADVCEDTRLRCAIHNLEERIRERVRDGNPKDQLEEELKPLKAEREALHARYRKAKG